VFRLSCYAEYKEYLFQRLLQCKRDARFTLDLKSLLSLLIAHLSLHLVSWSLAVNILGKLFSGDNNRCTHSLDYTFYLLVDLTQNGLFKLFRFHEVDDNPERSVKNAV